MYVSEEVKNRCLKGEIFLNQGYVKIRSGRGGSLNVSFTTPTSDGETVISSVEIPPLTLPVRYQYEVEGETITYHAVVDGNVIFTLRNF